MQLIDAERHLVDKEVDRPFGELVKFKESVRPESAVLFEPKHQSVGGRRFEGGALESDRFAGAAGASQNEDERSGRVFDFEEDLCRGWWTFY